MDGKPSVKGAFSGHAAHLHLSRPHHISETAEVGVVKFCVTEVVYVKSEPSLYKLPLKGAWSVSRDPFCGPQRYV